MSKHQPSNSSAKKGPLVLEPHHRFHSYCARSPSEVAEAAINDYSRKSDSVLDPFCGSGTTLVAGLAFKRSVVGEDVGRPG